jgi:hypothetical protein
VELIEPPGGNKNYIESSKKLDLNRAIKPISEAPTTTKNRLLHWISQNQKASKSKRTNNNQTQPQTTLQPWPSVE